MATRLLLVTLFLVIATVDYMRSNAATTPPINQGPPGKIGPKGDKGESSTFYINEEKNRRFASKLTTLHKQLTTVQDQNEVLSTKLEKTEQLLNSTEEKLSNEIEVLSTKLEKTEHLLNSTEQKLATVEKLFEEYQRTTESRFSELTERLGLIGVRSCQDVPAFYGTTNNGTYLIQPNPWVPSVNVTCYFNENTGVMHRLASCADVARIHGTSRDGRYVIRPDLSLPAFDVECTFNGSTATTIIHHDSEEEIEVSDCYHPMPMCYHRRIYYDATIPQIRALISLDGKCRQFIKYRCWGSPMFEFGNYVGWKTWDGTMRRYWGGSGGRDGYCACGVTGTCAHTYFKCNCDASGQVWREDSGLLDQEEDLPVTKLYFGDNFGSRSNGHHTLGSLMCEHQI